MKKAAKDLITGICAALPTPVLLIVSTANKRYLTNQDDFGYQVSLLTPYVLLALGVSVVGVILYLRSSVRFVQVLLWGYYLLAPCYLVYRVLRKLN